MAGMEQLLIGNILRTPLANMPGQEIVHAGVSRYSYAGFRDRIGRLASALARLGVGRGNVVAVMDWDSHRYFETYFAVPMMGAVLHTVNVRLAPEQLLYTINHARDDVILVHEDFVPMLAAIAGRITRRVRFVLMQDAPGPVPEGLDFAGEYEALLDAGDPGHVFAGFDERTKATIFYTTGTTGEPKGVSFSHRQIMLHTLAAIAALSPVPGRGGLKSDDVYMPITPLFHVHAWGFPYVATLLGLKQVYPGRYEPARLLRTIAEHDVSFSHCVPTIMSMLLADPEVDNVDLSRWKVIIGGSALTPGLAAQAMARGIDIYSGYGMSETCPVLTLADAGAAATASGDAAIAIRTATGKAVPLVELATLDADGRVLPRDGRSAGEIVARAPWLTEGFVGNDEATEALWQGGWLYTGDIGTLDAGGTLRIGDRLKDVIKSGGEWISSLDLEKIASTVPGVAEAAAIGLADPRWGERPCLVLRLAEGADEGETDIAVRAAVDDVIAGGGLAKWARPDRVVFLDELPKTSVGKLDKKRMRSELAT